MFDNLAPIEGVEEEKDVTFTKGPLESGLYQGIIKLAYTGKSKGGAMSVTVHVDLNGRMHRETLWVTTGDAKGNVPFYTKQDGSKAYLPGYNVFSALAELTVGKTVNQLGTEDKVVKLYDYEAKKEIPQTVPVITELLDQPVYVGLVKQIEDKTTKADDGSYVPTGETREINLIDKIFRASDKATTTEAKAKGEPVFVEKWLQANEGNTRDRSTKDAGTAGSPVKVGAAAQAQPAVKPLFG